MGLSYRWSVAVVCFVVVATFAGCDSTEDTATPTDVAGEYVFTDLRFVAASSALPPVVVLDTLVTSGTRLQLFSSGRYTLLYQFQGGQAAFVGGDFSATGERIRLKGRSDEAAFYRQILLGPEMTLRRAGPDSLSAAISTTVNLEEYADRYRGLRTVDGVVYVALVRR